MDIVSSKPFFRNGLISEQSSAILLARCLTTQDGGTVDEKEKLDTIRDSAYSKPRLGHLYLLWDIDEISVNKVDGQ